MNNTKVGTQYPSIDESLSFIPPVNKGLGMMDRAIALNDLPNLGWNLLREDLSLPTAILYEDKLAHNLEWMQAFAAASVSKIR